MERYIVKFMKLTEDLLLRLDASDDSASQSSLGQESSECSVLLPSNFILNILRNPTAVLVTAVCALRTHRVSGLHFPLLFMLLLLTMDRSWTSGPRRQPGNHELGKHGALKQWRCGEIWKLFGHAEAVSEEVVFYSFASDQARRFELCEEERKKTDIYFVVCCHGDNYLGKHRVHKLL